MYRLLFAFCIACVLPLGVAMSSTPLPENPDPPDEPLRPEGFDLQGHRGARGLMPENTIPAFRKALELGVTTLELDVVISKDNKVVVSHEPWMSSTICTLPSGEPVPEAKAQNYRIYGMMYSVVQQFDCGSRTHPEFPEQQTMEVHKPLLRDVIEMAETYMAEHRSAPVFYNIETKSRPEWDGEFHPEPEQFARLVYDVVSEMNVSARTTLQSFDVRTLQVAKDEGWPVRIALLVSQQGDEGISENIDRLGFRPDIYSPDYHLVDEDLIIKARGWGVDIIPWTVNYPNEMRKLKEMGVDGLITDYPNRGQFLVEQ